MPRIRRWDLNFRGAHVGCPKAVSSDRSLFANRSGNPRRNFSTHRGRMRFRTDYLISTWCNMTIEKMRREKSFQTNPIRTALSYIKRVNLNRSVDIILTLFLYPERTFRFVFVRRRIK